MLIRDPAKRATLAVVSKHAWMRAEVPHRAISEQSKSHERLINSISAESPGASAVAATSVVDSKNVVQGAAAVLKMNDQVLRVMQSLGIDPNRTKDSVLGKSLSPIVGFDYEYLFTVNGVKKMKWFLSLMRCHFHPRVTEGHKWLEKALSEK